MSLLILSSTTLFIVLINSVYFFILFWSHSPRMDVPICLCLTVLPDLTLSAKFIDMLLFPVPGILMKISNIFSPKMKLLGALLFDSLHADGALSFSDDTSSSPTTFLLPLWWKSCQKCWALPVLLPKSWGKPPMTRDETAVLLCSDTLLHPWSLMPSLPAGYWATAQR